MTLKKFKLFFFLLFFSKNFYSVSMEELLKVLQPLSNQLPALSGAVIRSVDNIKKIVEACDSKAIKRELKLSKFSEDLEALAGPFFEDFCKNLRALNQLSKEAISSYRVSCTCPKDHCVCLKREQFRKIAIRAAAEKSFTSILLFRDQALQSMFFLACSLMIKNRDIKLKDSDLSDVDPILSKPEWMNIFKFLGLLKSCEFEFQFKKAGEPVSAESSCLQQDKTSGASIEIDCPSKAPESRMEITEKDFDFILHLINKLTAIVKTIDAKEVEDKFLAEIAKEVRKIFEEKTFLSILQEPFFKVKACSRWLEGLAEDTLLSRETLDQLSNNGQTGIFDRFKVLASVVYSFKDHMAKIIKRSLAECVVSNPKSKWFEMFGLKYILPTDPLERPGFIADLDFDQEALGACQKRPDLFGRSDAIVLDRRSFDLTQAVPLEIFYVMTVKSQPQISGHDLCEHFLYSELALLCLLNFVSLNRRSMWKFLNQEIAFDSFSGELEAIADSTFGVCETDGFLSKPDEQLKAFANFTKLNDFFKSRFLSIDARQDLNTPEGRQAVAVFSMAALRLVDRLIKIKRILVKHLAAINRGCFLDKIKEVKASFFWCNQFLSQVRELGFVAIYACDKLQLKASVLRIDEIGLEDEQPKVKDAPKKKPVESGLCDWTDLQPQPRSGEGRSRGCRGRGRGKDFFPKRDDYDQDEQAWTNVGADGRPVIKTDVSIAGSGSTIEELSPGPKKDHSHPCAKAGEGFRAEFNTIGPVRVPPKVEHGKMAFKFHLSESSRISPIFVDPVKEATTQAGGLCWRVEKMGQALIFPLRLPEEKRKDDFESLLHLDLGGKGFDMELEKDDKVLLTSKDNNFKIVYFSFKLGQRTFLALYEVLAPIESRLANLFSNKDLLEKKAYLLKTFPKQALFIHDYYRFYLKEPSVSDVGSRLNERKTGLAGMFGADCFSKESDGNLAFFTSAKALCSGKFVDLSLIPEGFFQPDVMRFLLLRARQIDNLRPLLAISQAY